MPALFNLVGLSGYARTGKDTVAKILVDNHGFTRVAFADKLREAMYKLNPLLTREATGYTGYMWLADLVDEVGWEDAKAVSPEIRTYLQRLGTEVGRDLFGQNFWVDLALDGLDPFGYYVVTDVRFPNEAESITDRGGIVARVERPGVGPANSHASETSLDNWLFDIRISNDGTPSDLAEDIDAMVGVVL